MRFKHVHQACAGMAALITAVVLSAGGCGELSTESPSVVPVLGLDQPDVIKDQFFVIMPEGSTKELIDRTKQQVHDLGGSVIFTYERAPVGFAAKMPPDVLHAMTRNDTIKYIEADRYLSPNGIQTCPPWNLDRIDQVSSALDGVYAYETTGAGVDVYVIDSGVDGSHPELMGRVSGGKRFAEGNVDDTLGTGDCNGHGTHVAAIIAGKTVGVAKSANLHPVRVADMCGCDAYAEGAAIKAGIEWIQGEQGLSPDKPAVAVLGYTVNGNFDTLVGAITNAIHDNNLVAVLSAGNKGIDAKDVSPAKAEDALTVGAVDSKDVITPFSNFGERVDVYAPGSGIRSAKLEKTDACVAPLDPAEALYGLEMANQGTSQAAAHVAGVAAMVIEKRLVSPSNASLKAIDVMNEIKEEAAKNLLVEVPGGSNNRGVVNIYNTASTTLAADEDGCNDGAPVCVGDACGDFCGADGKCCGDLVTCGGGVVCKGGSCESCGGLETACCTGATDAEQCLPEFRCYDGSTCSCGKEGQLCCTSTQDCVTTDPTDPLDCNDLNQMCETCGSKDEICCNGACSETDTPALACNAANTCVECGIESHPCCQGECKDATQQCNAMSICEHCGLNDELCCDTGCADWHECNPNTSRCFACGNAAGLPCCNGECGGGLACNPNTNLCQDCGEGGQICCPGQACDGALACDSADNTCKGCGGDGALCCPAPQQLCAGGLECNGGTCQDTCGGPGAPCCGNACDPPWPAANGMVCNSNSGNCEGFCFARCDNGALLHPNPNIHVASAAACINFAENACTAYMGFANRVARVEYNFNNVLDNGAAHCSAQNQACCGCDAGLSCQQYMPGGGGGFYAVGSGEHCVP